MIFKNIVGRIIYYLCYPILMLILRGSTRAYAIIRLEDKILLTQSMLDYKLRWHLPGGGIKRNETAVIGLRREIYEELGIKVSDKDLALLTEKPIASKHHYVYYIYLLDLDSIPALSLRRFEITDARFVALSEIHSIPISDTVKKSLTLIPLK